MKIALNAAAAAVFLCATPSVAQEVPYTPGTYWEFSMVDLEDGQGPAYVDFLASRWRRNQEFAKSKGWIKSYHVFSNDHNREGEPDLYLVTEFERMPNPQEELQRQKEFEAFTKLNERQLAADNGTRAKMRTIKGAMLLREMNLKAQ